MAVMLTQWSPVPWSGETVSRPSLPPPAEGAAPTPIYETLVREWSRAGRTVPGQAARGGYGEPEDGAGLRWWRVDDGANRSYGAPPAAPVPAPDPAPRPTPPPAPAPGGTYGGSSAPYGSASTSGEADADAAGDSGDSGDSAPGPAPKPPVWERVAIL